MNKLIYILSTILTLTFTLKPVYTQEVKVMSFNIRVGVDGGDKDWNNRKQTVANTITQENPDFMGVQESLPNQTADLDALLSDYHQFGRGREANGGGEGSQIFYKSADWELDPNNNGTFQLSPTPEEWGSNGWGFGWVRICTWGRFTHKQSGKSMYVFNTHYPLNGEHRTKCSELIAQRIASRAYPNEPVVLTGDFNADEGEYCMRYLKGDESGPIDMDDTYRVLYPNDNQTGTYSGWGGGPIGGAKIDYVLAMGYTQVTSAKILYPNSGQIVSDHFPIVGTIALGEVTPPDPISIPARIEAEDYFTMSGIQSETTTDVGGGQNIGWSDEGDFLTYEIITESAGTMEFDFRLASAQDGSAFEVYIDDQLQGNISPSNTGDWQNWSNQKLNAEITAGTHTLKLVVTGAGFNLNYIDAEWKNPDDSTPTDTGAFSIKALSMNLWRYNSGNWSGDRIFNCRDLVLGEQPDVIGIQEGDEGKGEELVALLSNYTQEKGPWNDGSTNIYYNHNTLEIVETGVFGYSSSPDNNAVRDWGDGAIYGWLRVCNWVLFRQLSTGQQFYVFNTHLDPNGFTDNAAYWRRQEAELVMERINARSNQNAPFILMGDLNGVEGESYHQYLLGSDGNNPIPLVDTYREILPNGPGDSFGGVKYDYILVEDDVAVQTTDAAIIYHSQYGFTSDHNQVVASITFNGSDNPDNNTELGYDTTATGGRLFADYDNVDMAMDGFGGSNWQEVNNPSLDAMNESDRVASTVKGAETWAGVFSVGTFEKVDFAKHPYLIMKVYGPQPTSVLAKFELSSNSDDFFELSVDTKYSNQWEEIFIDFSNANSNYYDRLTIFFDFGNGSTDTWYFDDIRLESNAPDIDCNGDVNGSAYYDDCEMCVGGNSDIPENSCVVTDVQEFDSDDFHAYPNPANSWLNITTTQETFLYHSTGQLIQVFSAATINTFDVSHLPAGVYYLISPNSTKKLAVAR